MTFKYWITKTLDLAGVTINGGKPRNLQVCIQRFYRRVAKGAVGLGETYVDGD